MPTLQWALTCNRVITDGETNSVSYIDALEAFAVSSFPIPFPPICVATLWRRKSSRDILHPRLRIENPSGKTIQTFEPSTPTPLSKQRHRLNVILGGAPIESPGEYHIVIEQRVGKSWRVAQTLPIDISQLATDDTERKEPKPAGRTRRQTKTVQQRHAAGSAARRR
jgi:hypothetical protein